MTQPPPPGQGPINPQGAFRAPPPPPNFGGSPPPPPPPPGMMPPPMWFPPPPPQRSAGSRWAGLIFGTLATLIFTGSLLMNGCWVISSAMREDTDHVRERVITSGNPTEKVAVVPVDGIIMGREAEKFDKLMEHVEKESGVKALVIEVDTPGGDVSASDEMYQRVLRYKADHPDTKVTISMKGLATSGGYYLSCAGDQIFAEPTALTANIGVLMPRYNLSELADKWGVKDSTLKSQGSPFKDAGSMLKPENPRDTAYMQALIDEMYTQFKDVVKKGREKQIVAKKQTVDAIADGRAMTAKEALSKGIIDQIGYPSDAYKYAASTAGLSKPTVVKYDERPSLTDLFVGQSSFTGGNAKTVNGVNVNVDRQLIEELARPRLMYLWTGE